MRQRWRLLRSQPGVVPRLAPAARGRASLSTCARTSWWGGFSSMLLFGVFVQMEQPGCSAQSTAAQAVTNVL